MLQHACLVLNRIAVSKFASLLAASGKTGIRLCYGLDIKLYVLIGLDRIFFLCLFGHSGFDWSFSFAHVFQRYCLIPSGIGRCCSTLFLPKLCL